MTDTGFQAKRHVCTAYSAAVALMLCIPHEYWNNLFAPIPAVLSVLACLSCCRITVPSGRLRVMLDAAIAVFLLIVLISPLHAAYPAAALRIAVFYFTGAGFGFCAALLFTRPEDAEPLFRWMYAALLFTACYGLIRYFAGRDVCGVRILGKVLTRLGSTMEHGINYAEFVSLALPPVFVWAEENGGRFRPLLLLSLMLPVWALFLTYSRTGYLALFPFVLLLFSYAERRRALLIAVPLILLFLPEAVKVRALSMLRFTDESASGRFTLWKGCLEMLKLHWLAGVGPGSENFLAAYLPVSPGEHSFTPPHTNMGYLEIFLSLGIFGISSFLVFFLGMFPLLKNAARRASIPRDRRYLLALYASLAGAALASIPEHIWFYPRILFFWCVIYGTAWGITQ